VPARTAAKKTIMFLNRAGITMYETKSKKKLNALRIVSEQDKEDIEILKKNTTALKEEIRELKDTARVNSFESELKQKQIDLLMKENIATRLTTQELKSTVARLEEDEALARNAALNANDDWSENGEFVDRVAALDSIALVASEDQGELFAGSDSEGMFSNLINEENNSSDVRDSFDFSRLGPPATKADKDEDERSEIASHYEDYEDEREFEESIDQGGAFVII
jgi:hypothetical protein